MSPALRWRVRDLAADLLYRFGAHRPPDPRKLLLTMVTLHRVLPREQLEDYSLPKLALTPERLSEILAYLTRHYCCLPLHEAYAAWRTGERSEHPLAAVTLDDGQLDNFLYARPVLDHYGVRATFFVPVGFVGSDRKLWHDVIAYCAARASESTADPLGVLREVAGEHFRLRGETLAAALVSFAKILSSAERRDLIDALTERWGRPETPAWDGMMSWEQVRSLAAAGHEIGCHAMSHEILRGQQPEALEREVVEARRVLERELRAPVHCFCYPNGDYDESAVDAVRAAGYQCAVTSGSGLNARGADSFTLKRLSLQSEQCEDRHGVFSPEILAWRLSGRFPRQS